MVTKRDDRPTDDRVNIEQSASGRLKGRVLQFAPIVDMIWKGLVASEKWMRLCTTRYLFVRQDSAFSRPLWICHWMYPANKIAGHLSLDVSWKVLLDIRLFQQSLPDIVGIGEVDSPLVRLLLDLDRLNHPGPWQEAFKSTIYY